MKNKSISNQNVDKIFIISDEGTDLSYLFEHLGIITTQEQTTNLRFQIFAMPPTLPLCELYIFPRNRQLKPYCELYNSLLGPPTLIIYVMDMQSSINEAIQWLNLFQKQLQTKIVFFSHAKTYLERQQILAKISTLFLKNVNNEVYFPFLNASAVMDCFYNLKNVGVPMQVYARHIPAVSRLKWIWKRIKFWKKLKSDKSDQSII